MVGSVECDNAKTDRSLARTRFGGPQSLLEPLDSVVLPTESIVSVMICADKERVILPICDSCKEPRAFSRGGIPPSSLPPTRLGRENIISPCVHATMTSEAGGIKFSGSAQPTEPPARLCDSLRASRGNRSSIWRRAGSPLARKIRKVIEMVFKNGTVAEKTDCLEQRSPDQSSERLFDITWAETDQYFVLVWAQDKEDALRKWRSRHKEHWCAELFSRDICGGPRIKEVNQNE